MKKKIVIPKGLLIPDISHAGILGLDTYKAAPEKIKKEPKKAVEPTLKELKLKCVLRNLSQAGTKKVLSQRLKDNDEKIRTDKIFGAQEENRIIKDRKTLILCQHWSDTDGIDILAIPTDWVQEIQVLEEVATVIEESEVNKCTIENLESQQESGKPKQQKKSKAT